MFCSIIILYICGNLKYIRMYLQKDCDVKICHLIQKNAIVMRMVGYSEWIEKMNNEITGRYRRISAVSQTLLAAIIFPSINNCLCVSFLMSVVQRDSSPGDLGRQADSSPPNTVQPQGCSMKLSEKNLNHSMLY